MSKCTACGDKPENTAKDFTKAVIEINNPETLVLLRKVVIPASMGDDTDVVPAVGKYHNVILQYEANGHIYLYSSDGIPTAIEANIPQEVLDRIEDLEIDVDLLETGLANETTAREAADSALSSSINSLSSSLSAETEAREQADAALEGSINNLTADLEEEATTRETADTALGSRIDTVADNLATETANRISADEDLQADIAAEATARQNADTTLQNNITAEATARANADTALNTAITAEASTRQTADAGLQSQIDAITASSDVKDIVGTKAELNNYDTSTLGNNDIIKVLQDESENNATTYYRWNATTQQFSLIGEEGPYYTKSQTDTLLNAKQNTLTAGSNVQIVNDTISATDTTYTAGTGLALNGTQFSVDTTTIATQSDLTAGLANKQDTLTAGANVQINNNVISATDTTYTHFTGATASTDGVQGLVPGPLAGDEDKYLKGDGTWGTVQAGPTVVQTTGTSTTDVMSQNAVTSMVFADPSVLRRIQIGSGAHAYANDEIIIGKGAESNALHTIAIGESARCYGNYNMALGYGAISNNVSKIYTAAIGAISNVDESYSVALGSYSNATQKGQVDISTTLTTNTYGYNDSQYRLLTGLYDGQSAHDAATKGQLDSIAIKNAGAPTTATVGTVGQLLEDTTNGKLYICTDATNPYVWEEVGAGGSGPTVVQTTGNSTTDVMSQNAVTNMVYARNNPASGVLYDVRIGKSALVANNNPSGSVAIGDYAEARGRQSVALGGSNGTNGSADARSNYSIAIGHDSSSAGENAVALGAGAWTGDKSSVSPAYSVALGANSTTSVQGEVSFGGTKLGTKGYNNSQYRLLTNVYDPQNAHDAATKGYVDGLVGNIDTALQVILNGGES